MTETIVVPQKGKTHESCSLRDALSSVCTMVTLASRAKTTLDERIEFSGAALLGRRVWRALNKDGARGDAERQL